MPTEIKICGVTTSEALAAVRKAGAEYVGFVFFPPSPRHLGFVGAARLARMVEPPLRKVGVFVDPDDATVAEAMAAASLDAIQLHKTSPGRRRELAARFGVPVWHAAAVASAADIAGALTHGDDLVLFDAKTPEDAALPGGMGLRFDWTLLAGIRAPRGFGVAGGLGPGNVAEALRITGARLVDTSSGVESSPGVKDPDRIAAFCAEVRAAGA